MSQLHEDALRQLCPVSLGPNHEADMALEGQHLDEIEADAADLKNEFFPDTCTLDGLLEDWERLLGIPDDCAGLADTEAERVAAVMAKWTEKRKISEASLVEVAAKLGYTITITKYTVRRYGEAMTGGEYIGKEWANTLTLNVPAEGSNINDELNELIEDEAEEEVRAEVCLEGVEALECAILRRRPAHNYVVFNYTE